MNRPVIAKASSKRVHYRFLWLLAACLFSASLVVSGQGEKTIVVLGDSIAAGYGIDQNKAFPALLQKKVEGEGLNYKVVNAGLSGDTTAGGARRIGWLLKRPMDVLLVELGGNDGLRGIPPEETRANLEKIIDTAREKNPALKVLVTGMQMPQNMGTNYTEKFREVFPAVAKSRDATLIPFLLEGVGGVAELNQPDRIHPTEEGHRIIAETVWPYLVSVLNGTNAPALVR